jgi:hypothetical protein
MSWRAFVAWLRRFWNTHPGQDEGEHRVGAGAALSPTPSGPRQCCFEVAPEALVDFMRALRVKGRHSLPLPGTLEVVDTFATRGGGAVVLIRGEDPAMPWDGALVEAMFRRQFGAVVFERFDLYSGRYATWADAKPFAIPGWRQ